MDGRFSGLRVFAHVVHVLHVVPQLVHLRSDVRLCSGLLLAYGRLEKSFNLTNDLYQIVVFTA